MNKHFDPAPGGNAVGSMRGFDAEFTDIVDYIVRITRRIWEGKQVGLCHQYYSDDCPVYTLAGYTEGAEQVAQNTLKTLAAFPDRTLHADNIIWGGNDQDGFHSSHLIRTYMTNLGASEFGEATGKRASIQVIAHCIVRENKVVEEWLVRDNHALCVQLGVDPLAYARERARQPLDPASTFARWLSQEYRRVEALPRDQTQKTVGEGAAAAVCASLSNIWNERLIGDSRLIYAAHARLHASARPCFDGIEAIQGFYLQILGALPDARISIAYPCDNAMLAGDYLAVRWTIAGHHHGHGIWGPPTGAPVLILGESHYRLDGGLVVEEWLVFDELAVLTQIERARLDQPLAAD